MGSQRIRHNWATFTSLHFITTKNLCLQWLNQLFLFLQSVPHRKILNDLPLELLPVFSSVQLFSHVQLFGKPWTAACQTSVSFTISKSLLKLMSIESVMPSNHLILCHSLPLPPQSFLASGAFQTSQFFASGGQSIGVSDWASVLPMNIQHWLPLGWTGIRNCLKITTIIKKDALDYDSKLKSLKKRNQMLFIKAYLKFSLQGPGHHRG